MEDSRVDVSRDTQALMAFEANNKSTGLAYVIWFFLGWFGVHRFYLGYPTSGLLMLCLGIFGVLGLIGGFAALSVQPEHVAAEYVFIVLGFLALAVLVVWLLVDLFLIPSLARASNKRTIEEIMKG